MQSIRLNSAVFILLALEEFGAALRREARSFAQRLADLLLLAVTHGAGTRTVIADTVLGRINTGGTGTLVFRTSGDVEVATLTFSATAFGAASGPTANANAITADSSATGGTIAKAAFVGVTNGDVVLCSVTATGGGGDIELNSVVVSAGQQVSVSSLSYTACP